jgi:arsenate reductase
MLKVYGIANCDSCRKARKFLMEHDIDHEFHDVREEGLNIQMLERWADRMDWQQLVNRQSTTWRELPEPARVNLTRPKAMALLLQHPTLLKRPVFDHRDYFAVGFSEARFSEFLKRFA